MNMPTKRGQMTMEAGVSNAIMFVVLVIAASIGASIVAGVQSGQTAGSDAANISGFGLDGLVAFAGQFDEVGLVLGAALILSTLIAGMYFLFARK